MHSQLGTLLSSASFWRKGGRRVEGRTGRGDPRGGGKLITAAAAADNQDFAAAEIGIEDALFRAQSLLTRIRQAQTEARLTHSPREPGNGHEKN